jgi:hypothetical protein
MCDCSRSCEADSFTVAQRGSSDYVGSIKVIDLGSAYDFSRPTGSSVRVCVDVGVGVSVSMCTAGTAHHTHTHTERERETPSPVIPSALRPTVLVARAERDPPTAPSRVT